jgi:hypothetical protein
MLKQRKRNTVSAKPIAAASPPFGRSMYQLDGLAVIA